MTDDALNKLLEDIKTGAVSIERGVNLLRNLPCLDLGHTRFDLHRSIRNGFPEVIYGEGKKPGQVAEILAATTEHINILVTRVPEEMADYLLAIYPDATYNAAGRTLTLIRHPITYGDREIAIVTAGTSDLRVAEEAKTTCELLGSRAFIVPDVGVAGLHRLLACLETIRKARVIIVIAGMEGALSSVIGGLVSQPVIAVPTSVGYGASFAGISALLGMLASCASGVTVVNIDNGFGAACAACRINNL